MAYSLDSDWKNDSAAAWDKVAKGFSSSTPTSEGTNKGNKFSYALNTERCYQKHPPLSLGSGLVIYGGSCLTPVVKDADIYVGLDAGMARSKKAYPWNSGTEIYFSITDGSAPTDADEFRKMVNYLIEHITNGAKVHAGCIGGHGRTGLLLSAIVSLMLPGEVDAISYVRKNYCTKAVETTAQVNWLNAQYGIKSVEGSKSYLTTIIPGAKAKSGGKISVNPIRSKSCMWGPLAVDHK